VVAAAAAIRGCAARTATAPAKGRAAPPAAPQPWRDPGALLAIAHPATLYFASAAAVVNDGRMSFGTVFILSSAFWTSGRITTYLVIIALARA
jgi:hypothetical protein